MQAISIHRVRSCIVFARCRLLQNSQAQTCQGVFCFTYQYGRPCALTLRTRMHDLWFKGLSTGHVKRVPVHGMQGPLEKHESLPNPARPRSGPTKFWGTRLGLRQRPTGRTRCTACTQRLRVRQRECRASEAAGRVCAGERTWP